MKPIITHVLALLVACLAGCNQTLNQSDYCETVVAMLDPENPNPHSSDRTASIDQTNGYCGIKVGMLMQEVISTWGKPRALGITTACHATLIYGHCTLEFDTDKVESIRVDSERTVKVPTSADKAAPVPHTVAEAYYQRMNSLFRTNDSERAQRTLATNAVISVARLKSGEIASLRLGMTMSEFVGIMGKPNYFCLFTPKQATLWYGQGYDFRGDALSCYGVELPEDCCGIRFDNGLSAKARLAEFVQAFGKPLRITRDDFQYYLTYNFGKTYLTLCFGIPFALRNSAAAKEKAEFNGLSLHYCGLGEVCAEADKRLAEAVEFATGLDRDKVYLVKRTKNVTRALSVIEKETGRTLRADQRFRVEEALNEHKQAIQKAYEDDAE